MLFDGCLIIEPGDQCLSCHHYRTGVACPLLEALGVGIVYLEGPTAVKNCGFYKEFTRPMRVVK